MYTKHRCLIQQNEHASQVAPAVVQMLNDGDGDVRIAAVEVLDLLPLKALVDVGPDLVQVLRVPDPQTGTKSIVSHSSCSHGP